MNLSNIFYTIDTRPHIRCHVPPSRRPRCAPFGKLHIANYWENISDSKYSYLQVGGDLKFPQAGEFTRCGLAGLGQRLIHTPTVADHRIGIHAQAVASSTYVSYAPYTRFKPLENREEDSTTPRSETPHSAHASQVCLVFLFHFASYLASQSSRRRHLPDFDGNDTDGSQNLSGLSGTSSRNRNPRSLVGRERQGSYPSVQSPRRRSHSPHSHNPPPPRIQGPPPLVDAPSQTNNVPTDDPMNDLAPGCSQADTMDTSLTTPSQIPSGDCPSTSMSGISDVTSDVLYQVIVPSQMSSAHMDQDLPSSRRLTPGHLPSPRTTHLDQDLPMNSSPSTAPRDQELPTSRHLAPGCPTLPPLPPSDSPPKHVTTHVASAGGARLQADPMITDTLSTEAGFSLPIGVVTPTPSHLDVSMRPARPLPLPAAVGTVIDQAITERLEAATACLVQPTVQGIIDACIPRLTELIESHFATLTPAQGSGKASPCKETTRKAHSEPCEGDYDGDNEISVARRRKKPGPRGKMNRLHVSRDFQEVLHSSDLCI